MVGLVLSAVLGQPAWEADAAGGGAVARIPIVMPHPVITEVLYAVPTSGGDANQDGVRQASGDEFVEVYNPHAEAIQLKGYTITDRNQAGRGQFKFVFPEFELEAGGVAVVFNGAGSEMGGAVGDSSRAAGERHAGFGGAWVFTARVEGERVGFSNSGDFVVLWTPGGAAVECVAWGEFGEKIPAGALMVSRVAEVSDGSVQRAGLTAEWKRHTELASEVGGKAAGVAYSPGVFRLDGTAGSSVGAR